MYIDIDIIIFSIEFHHSLVIHYNYTNYNIYYNIITSNLILILE